MDSGILSRDTLNCRGGHAYPHAISGLYMEQWPGRKQGLVAMEEVAATKQRQQNGERCPRCESTETKFCYFNNYSLSQPRHYCKACRRHWTKGGTIRNVPVGGGGRRGKMSKRNASSSSAELPSSPIGLPHQSLSIGQQSLQIPTFTYSGFVLDDGDPRHAPAFPPPTVEKDAYQVISEMACWLNDDGGDAGSSDWVDFPGFSLPPSSSSPRFL